MTVIAGLCMHLVLGSVYSFGLLSPYMMSFLAKYSGSDKISIDDGFFLLPLAIFSTSITIGLSGFVEKKLGGGRL